MRGQPLLPFTFRESPDVFIAGPPGLPGAARNTSALRWETKSSLCKSTAAGASSVKAGAFRDTRKAPNDTVPTDLCDF